MSEIETAEIDGFVAQLTPISSFAVGTVDIVTDGATAFNDMAAEDLVIGSRLRIRGPLNNRVILADGVALPDKVKIESDVSSVEASGGRLTLFGLSLVVVRTDAPTKFTGVAGLSQMDGGSHVKIFGGTTGSGDVIATKILVKPSSGAVVLKGSVEAKNPPTLKVLGVEINTSPIPAGSFTGKVGGPVSADEFFSNLKIGDTVNAAGTLDGPAVIWSQIVSE
jgi:hypothetical protein